MDKCSRKGHRFKSYKVKEKKNTTEYEIRCRRCGKTPKEVNQ